MAPLSRWIKYFTPNKMSVLFRRRGKLIHKVVAFFKLGIHVSFLTFRHVHALFCELFREIANQLLYTSHNILDFVHFWFCEKLDEKLAVSSSLTFHENTDCLARMAKREMRKMIGETFYKMPSTHFLCLSFCQHFFAFSSIWREVYSWLYTYRFLHFDMFVHYFVNYFVRLRTNQYILLTILDFVHLWFCEKLDEKLAISSSLTFHENTDCLARMAKREMRKMIGETVYEMPSTHFLCLSFRQHFFTFSSIWREVYSWLYTHRFSHFDMFVHYFVNYFVNYFVRLRTNHYILLTISSILFIFDSVRNLTRN